MDIEINYKYYLFLFYKNDMIEWFLINMNPSNGNDILFFLQKIKLHNLIFLQKKY
jgi:hypothetical protein